MSNTNVKNTRLAVNKKGEALVTYTMENGTVRRVLVWGAINANAPSESQPQVRFKYDYASGWGKYRNKNYWKTFKTCGRYDGPSLPYFVGGCKAPDGSYWALQNWQRGLPLLGFKPWRPAQDDFELHVSHWSGDLPELQVGVHWTYGGSAIGIFGRLMYGGKPVHGFKSTAEGNPLGRYERNVYIDTFNSVYDANNWARESGILTHNPTGAFCHSFVPQKPFPGYPDQNQRPAAPGDRYRVTVMGPGVTPAVQWEGPGLPGWNNSAGQQQTQAKARAQWDEIMVGDKKCAPERS
jgi:hypothetical protein